MGVAVIEAELNWAVWILSFEPSLRIVTEK